MKTHIENLSPTFLNPPPQILKETIPFFTVLTDYAHFHCMDHLEILGGVCSLFPREHSWHCSMAHMNLLCLSGFSVLISAQFQSRAVSWEQLCAVQHYALH